MHRRILMTSIACFTALIGCHRHARVVTFVGGCTVPGPPIGPPSHLQLIRSSVADSLPVDHGRGRVVAFFRWSSDSLARKTPALPVRFELSSIAVWFDSAGYASVADTSNVLGADAAIPKAVLVTREGSYRLLVRALGAAPLDTTLSIRAGFTDTARVFLQASGVQMCS